MRLQTGIAAVKSYGNHDGDGGLVPGIRAISTSGAPGKVRVDGDYDYVDKETHLHTQHLDQHAVRRAAQYCLHSCR